VSTNLWEPVRTKAGPGQDGTQAPECDEHTAVVWNDDMVIFGGFIGGERVRAVHKFNFTRGEWTIVQFDEKDPQPVARAGHAAVLVDDNMYIFGGKNNDDFMMNDMWRLNLTTNRWEHLKCNDTEAPRGRAGHSMAVYNNHIIVFGGLYEITREMNDMYVFNVQKNEWRRLFKSSNEDNMAMTQKSDTLKSKKTRRDDSPDPSSTTGTKLNSMLTRSSTKKAEAKKPKIRSPKAAEEPVNLESPTSVTMKQSFLLKQSDKEFETYSATMKKHKSTKV